MAQIEKFLFETEFERPGADLLDRRDKRDPDTVPLYTEPDMTAARREAHEQGHAAGLDEARNEIAATVSSAVQDLGGHVTNLLGEVDTKIEDVRKEAAGLAFQIGRTLAGTLLDREPVLEIEAMIRECLGNLDTQDSSERLVLRVAPALAGEIRSLAGTLAEAAGFAGAIAVMDDESLDGANCSAEWSNGGAVRNLSASEEMIGAAVRRYIESSGQVPEPVIAPPATVETQDEPAPPADLHAVSKAVKIEEPVPPQAPAPPAEAEKIDESAAPDAAGDAGVAPSAASADGAGASEDAAAPTPQNTEGPARPSDQ